MRDKAIAKGIICGVCAALLVLFSYAPAPAQTYEWKLSESNPVRSEPGLFNEFFAQRVGELTGGKVKIKVYYGAALGSEKDCVGMVQMGTLGFTRIGAGNVAPFAPEIQAVLLPYLFDDRREANRVLRSDASRPLTEAIAKHDLRVISWNLEEDRSIFNGVRPIQKPADLKGLKIRVPSAKIQIETLAAMGASATPGPWPELYTALKTGVFDGAENGVNVYFFSRFQEVNKYFSNTRHFSNVCPVVMNNTVFEKLPNEIKDALVQAGKEAMIYQEGVYDRGRWEWVDQLKAAGVKFNDVDIEAFKKAVKPVFEKFKKEIGPDLVEPLEKAAK